MTYYQKMARATLARVPDMVGELELVCYHLRQSAGTLNATDTKKDILLRDVLRASDDMRGISSRCQIIERLVAEAEMFAGSDEQDKEFQRIDRLATEIEKAEADPASS